MNYIQEINAIHRDFEISGLSPKARLLWFVLLDLNNRQHWARSFQAPAALLLNQCGFSQRSLQRARAELVAAGRLGYQPGANGRLGRYTLHYLSAGQKRASAREAADTKRREVLLDAITDGDAAALWRQLQAAPETFNKA
jgi:hypothetical protein